MCTPPICDKTVPPHLENPGSATDYNVRKRVLIVVESSGLEVKLGKHEFVHLCTSRFSLRNHHRGQGLCEQIKPSQRALA